MMNRNMNNENESKIKKELTEGYGISEEIVNNPKQMKTSLACPEHDEWRQ